MHGNVVWCNFRNVLIKFCDDESLVIEVHLCCRRVAVSGAKCLVITAIATLHILSAGLDQFVDNVVRGNGALHQVCVCACTRKHALTYIYTHLTTHTTAFTQCRFTNATPKVIFNTFFRTSILLSSLSKPD